MRYWSAAIAALVIGFAYWLTANKWLEVSEPWDSAFFLPVYCGAIVLSLVLGLIVGGRSWLLGAIIVCAMLPVMLLQSGSGPLLAIGIIFLVVLAVPAALASMVGGYLRGRISSA